jgi:hypothetical protein
MTGTSTLFYLVDDMNIPSDTFLTPYQDTLLKDEYYATFLNLLEVDPGEDLVMKIMEKLETT